MNRVHPTSCCCLTNDRTVLAVPQTSSLLTAQLAQTEHPTQNQNPEIKNPSAADPLLPARGEGQGEESPAVALNLAADSPSPGVLSPELSTLHSKLSTLH
jgi:hypothetical protein